MLIIYIVLAFGYRRILFFLIFGDEKKMPEFSTAIERPNQMLLLLIIIEQNVILTKSNNDSRKTLVLRIISVPNSESIR